MFFKNKIKRSFDTLHYLNGDEKVSKEELEDFRRENKLEGKDILAMILSAVIVFAPLFIVIIIVLFLLV